MVLFVPLAFVMYMAIYSKKYIRGVVDFLSTGRLCGRYLISVAGVAGGLSIIGLVAYVETHYKTGFALAFWQNLALPVTVIMGLTGFFFYRYRQTKALSIGQFLEMRYSRKFRMFAAALRSISEILANMIMPAVAARFFIYVLDLPTHFTFLGIEFNTFGTLILVCLILALSIICISGDLGITITDTLQGLLMYPLLVAFIVFCLYKFSWFEEMAPVLGDRAEGESFLNPYDIKKLKDFNLFYISVYILDLIIHRGSWVTGGASRARSAHEQKMAGLLSDWRASLYVIFYVLIAVSILTVMNHVNYAQDARVIRTELSSQVAREIAPTAEIRDNIITSVSNIPQHNHVIGRDTPLSDKQNLDTPYIDAARVEFQNDPDGNGDALTQQFRALYNQMMLSVSIRHILPPGMLGLFLLLMVLAMISTDDSRIYSAAGTVSQDIILPMIKKPLTPKQHMMMIRLVSLGIGVIFFFGSFFMSQLDYINLFVAMMVTMWQGGCGPVMIFGLYSRFGNVWGAWSSLLSGMALGLGSIFLQRKWADAIYPYLEEHGMVESVGNFLAAVSRPFNPIIEWNMNAERCPINSYELYFLTMLITMVIYCVVSHLTNAGKEKFNLDRLLHRGIYAVDGGVQTKSDWSFKGIIRKMVGITPEYTRGDKIIAWSLFIYSIVFRFIIMFVVVIIINTISPISMANWSNYILITFLIIPGIVAVITTFWFGIGGIKDMIRLFRDLKARAEINDLDNGMVDGEVSLADKAAFEKIENEKKEAGNTAR
ncbi:MAG: sodium:panthothenate symporter [Lentisphaeria bacterium]|nr:sodium:panthothenate symporter [Lentisphaeria bacterium]